MAKTSTKHKAPAEAEPLDDSPIVDVPGFGKLTLRQKTFAERYREHGNGTRAAREAGYPGDDPVLASTAWRALKNVKVRWYLAKLGENDEISRGQVIDLLKGEAVNGDHAGARVRAQELLGKTQGMFGDDFVGAPNRLSDEALVALIAGKDAALGVELLRALRGESGAQPVQTIEHQP